MGLLGALVLIGAFIPSSMQAQFGRKILRKGNLDAVAKLGKAATLSDNQVKQLSLDSVRWMDANNPLATENDVYGDRLKRLVAGYGNEDGLELNFAVYLVEDINAFATPDGSIRVMAGLMNLLTDEELLSVIGHEIGHVKLKHSKKQYQKAYAVAAARDAAIANTGQAAVIAESQMGAFVEELLNAKFSRNDEAEADKYGFGFMVKHDHDYHAMQTAFMKIGAISGNPAHSIKSSHPDPGSRAENAKKWAEEEDVKRAAAAPKPQEAPRASTDQAEPGTAEPPPPGGEPTP